MHLIQEYIYKYIFILQQKKVVWWQLNVATATLTHTFCTFLKMMHCKCQKYFDGSARMSSNSFKHLGVLHAINRNFAFCPNTNGVLKPFVGSVVFDTLSVDYCSSTTRNTSNMADIIADITMSFLDTAYKLPNDILIDVINLDWCLRPQLVQRIELVTQLDGFVSSISIFVLKQNA